MIGNQQEPFIPGPHFKHVAIIGMGLLGSSIAAFLKKNWGEVKVTGISSSASIEKGLALHILDKGYHYSSMHKAFGTTDLVLFSTPVSHIIQSLKDWQKNPPHFRKGCIISDVGSTKATICKTAAKLFASHPQVCFIGSHPMAGSEKHGMAARDPHL